MERDLRTSPLYEPNLPSRAMTAATDALPEDRAAALRTPISLRVPARALAVIDRAAASQGRDRTEFMVAAALRAAHEHL